MLVLVMWWRPWPRHRTPSSLPRKYRCYGVPAIPVALAETAGRYKESRAAFAPSWHPQRHELLISTRFANTYQTHLVKMPGGSRQQLTFFPEPVYGGWFHPLAATTSFFKRMSAAANGTKFFATTSPPATAHFLPTGISKPSRAVVYRRRGYCLHLDPAHGAGYRPLDYEPGGPENRSSPDAIEGRRVVPGRLVAGRQTDPPDRGNFSQRKPFVDLWTAPRAGKRS